jgi:multidrug efflux system membrane fusion protein
MITQPHTASQLARPSVTAKKTQLPKGQDIMHRFSVRTSLSTALRALAITLPAAAMLALAGCGTQAAQNSGPPPADVNVAPVVSESVHQWDEFTGRIAAVETVELRPRVSGYIDRVAFKEGQEVKKGDLLFVIDQRPYQAQLAQAQAQLERARSDAKLAHSQNARAEALIAVKAISREDFDSRHAATESGDAAARAADAAVTAARLNLQFTEVRAPIAGRISRALVTVGNLAQTDTTLLTTLVSLDPMYVYFDTDEQTYLRYQDQAKHGREGGNPVRVALANEAGFPHDGTLDFVDNQVDANTGTIRARAVLPNTDRLLTPGLFARVRLQGTAEFSALLVSDKAILTDQDRKYVYVLGSDSTAQRRDVALGGAVDGLRVVTSGLQSTDRVVVDGLQKVFFPGMPLKPTIVEMAEPQKPAAVAQR